MPWNCGWRRPWANIGRRAACCWKCSIPASNHGWMRSAHNSGPASRWRTWSRPWTGRKVGTGRSTDPWCPGRLRNPRRCWRRTSSGARSCASTGSVRRFPERPPGVTACACRCLRRFANPTAACFPTINCRRCSPSSSNATAAWPSVFAMRRGRRCSSPAASTPGATSAYRSTCATLVRRRALRY